MNPIRLLIVEDESVVVRDLENRLTDLGYTVVGRADNGPDAIARASELQPNAILMDIRLVGEMDGIDAAIAIHRHQDVPVIFLTAFGEKATIEKAKLAEPSGYALKPFDDRELSIVIEMALFKRQAEIRQGRSTRSKWPSCAPHWTGIGWWTCRAGFWT